MKITPQMELEMGLGKQVGFSSLFNVFTGKIQPHKKEDVEETLTFSLNIATTPGLKQF